MMSDNLQPPATLFDASLADENPVETGISMELAQKVFDYFQQSPLFRWKDANNDCEDRANAICILLDQWTVANAKAWVFSGSFLAKDNGSLTNRWNYHVAAALPVQQEDKIVYYVIDPATSSKLVPVDIWALQITESPNSYHLIKQGVYYIFPTGKISRDNWHKRNRRNLNWTMQGLSGINGASSIGRAQLAFHKRKVKETAERFNQLRIRKPDFIK